MDNLGQNALHFAARSGHDGIVQYMTQYLKNYEKVELPGWISPLGTVAAVRSLVKVENLLGRTPIVLAALRGHGDVVQHLLQWENVSLRSEIMFGLFPIHLAAQRGSVATYRLLTEGHNVDTDVLDPKGYHSFVIAADWNNDKSFAIA